MPDPERPRTRVFISYSHDSESHSNKVIQLAAALRENQIDAEIDQYEPMPAQGWGMWMTQQIKRTDFVIIICTESYRLRFEQEQPDPTSGKRATFEGCVITQNIYEDCQYTWKHHASSSAISTTTNLHPPKAWKIRGARALSPCFRAK